MINGIKFHGNNVFRVGLLVNILAFLLCEGMAYFFSNLTTVFTNLVTKGSLFMGSCFF